MGGHLSCSSLVLFHLLLSRSLILFSKRCEAAQQQISEGQSQLNTETKKFKEEHEETRQAAAAVKGINLTGLQPPVLPCHKDMMAATQTLKPNQAIVLPSPQRSRCIRERGLIWPMQELTCSNRFSSSMSRLSWVS